MDRATAVLLLNLGGPDSIAAVRPFLFNLFSDREIIRLGPAFMQKPLAWLIAHFRAKKTSEMYRRIGGKSPIVEITTAQANALQRRLNELAEQSSMPGRFRVYTGMRYWHPFIAEAVGEIIEDGAGDVVIFSLYPHYSCTTTGSAISEFKRVIERTGLKGSKIHYIDRWYDFPPYIDALTKTVAETIEQVGGRDFALIYSAHSLPASFIKRGDPYLAHIRETVEAVNARLVSSLYGISDLRWYLSFQSRTGPVKWLEPSTDEVIRDVSDTGIRDIVVVPVSFVSDHIETLYEIDILYRDMAEALGVCLHRCRALNTMPEFIEALAGLVLRALK